MSAFSIVVLKVLDRTAMNPPRPGPLLMSFLSSLTRVLAVLSVCSVSSSLSRTGSWIRKYFQQNILNVVLSHYLPTSLSISLSRFLKSWHRIKMFSWSSVWRWFINIFVLKIVSSQAQESMSREKARVCGVKAPLMPTWASTSWYNIVLETNLCEVWGFTIMEKTLC